MSKLEIIFKEVFELNNGVEASIITIPIPTGKLASVIGQFKTELSFAETNRMQTLKGVISEEVMEMAQDIKTESEVKKEDKKTEDEKIKDLEIEAINTVKTLGLGNAKMDKIYNLLKKCLVKGFAKFNDETKITDVLWDDIPMAEIDRILGYYIINFANTSD